MLEQDKRHLKKQLAFIEATQQIPQSVRTACALVTTSDRLSEEETGQRRRPGEAPRAERAAWGSGGPRSPRAGPGPSLPDAPGLKGSRRTAPGRRRAGRWGARPCGPPAGKTAPTHGGVRGSATGGQRAGRPAGRTRGR